MLSSETSACGMNEGQGVAEDAVSLGDVSDANRRRKRDPINPPRHAPGTIIRYPNSPNSSCFQCITGGGSLNRKFARRNNGQMAKSQIPKRQPTVGQMKPKARPASA